MEVKPDVILHVGMDKTGTSAIQFALQAAHDTLRADHGILVPQTGLWHDYSHHPFAFAALGIAGYSATDLTRLFADLRKEIANTPCKTVLLTSECLFKVPFRQAHAAFMANLSEIFDQIRVVVYVRRQDIWIESRHRHSVVSGREVKVQRLMSNSYSGYLQFIDSWAALVGVQNVSVRPYEASQFANGDIAADFQAVIGLPEGTLPSQRDSRHNVTFHADAVLLRSTLNHLHLPALLSSEVNKLLLNIPISVKDVEKKFLSPSKAIAVISTYAAMNAEIARKYLGREVLFMDAPPNVSKSWEYPELSADRMVELLGYLTRCDARLVAAISARARSAAVASLPSAVAAKMVWALLTGLSTLEGEQPNGVNRGKLPKDEVLEDWPSLPAPERRFDLGGLVKQVRNWANEAALTVSLGLRRLPTRGSAIKPLAATLLSKQPFGTPAPAQATVPIKAGPARSRSAPKAIPQANELLVHFGVLKTGSSSIQATLFAHADRLQGAAYVHGSVANSSLMLRQICQSKQRLVKILGPHANEKRIDNNSVTSRAKLLAAMSAAKKRSDRLVLSAEIICSFGAGELETLSEILTPHAKKMHFVGYLRDPVSLSRSIFQERIKNKVEPDFNFDNALLGGIRMHGIVERLDQKFGRENVTVYPFERSQFPDGDVVRHFLQVAKIDAEGLDIQRVNESLSYLAVKALYTYRRLKTPIEDPKEAKSREAFVSSLREIKGPAFAFHPELQALILKKAEVFDDWAEKRLGQRLTSKDEARADGLRVEQDLFAFTADEIGILADFAGSWGIKVTSAYRDQQWVAELMSLIRLSVAKGQDGLLARHFSRPLRREYSGAG